MILQNFWVKDHRQIYLIGNPFIWWLGTASVLAYVAVRGFLIIRAQRGYKDFLNSEPPLLLHGSIRLTQTFLESRCRQSRPTLRLPLPRMVSPLPALLPHGTAVIPPSLSPRALLLYSPIRGLVRCGYGGPPAAREASDRGGPGDRRHCDLCVL